MEALSQCSISIIRHVPLYGLLIDLCSLRRDVVHHRIMPGEHPLVGSNPGEDASHKTGYVRGLPPCILIVLRMIEDLVLLLVSILHGVIQGEDVVLLLVVLLFIEAFQ